MAAEKIDDSNREAAIRLQVAEEHLPYVSPVEEMLEGSDDTVENYAIRAGGEVVGFFKLDFDQNRVATEATGVPPYRPSAARCAGGIRALIGSFSP